MPAGQTSLQFVTVGDPGNAPDADPDHDRLRLGRLRLPDGQVRRDGRPVLPVPQRRGEDATPTALYNSWHGHGLCRPIGITQSGSSGSYSYAVTGSDSQGRQLSDLRCHLGRCGPLLQLAAKRPARPAAAGAGTTETGAYTLNGETTNAA